VNSTFPAGGWSIATPLAIDPFDDPVQNEAYPGIHQQAEIEPVRDMASCRRQMWHQDKKVKQVACDNGNGLLEKSSKHAVIWTPPEADSMPEIQQLATSN